jgi:hypothetical protein
MPLQGEQTANAGETQTHIVNSYFQGHSPINTMGTCVLFDQHASKTSGGIVLVAIPQNLEI